MVYEHVLHHHLLGTKDVWNGWRPFRNQLDDLKNTGS